MRTRYVVLGLILALPLSLAQPVAAQELHSGEWAIGYSFLGNNDIAKESSTLPLGWYGAGAYRLSDSVEWAFDLSGNYAAGIDVCGGIANRSVPAAQQPANCLEGVVAATTEEFQGLSYHRAEAQWCSPTLSTCDVKTVSIGGVTGPRFGMRSGSVRPFVHIMAGAVRSVRKIAFFSHTSTNLAIQPGGGVDIDAGDNIAWRFQVDYRMIMHGDPSGSSAGLVVANGSDWNEFRFATGVVFKLGSR